MTMIPHKAGERWNRVRAFSISDRLRSFRYAASGIAFMLQTQDNARLHLLATLVVVAAGWRLQMSAPDWGWLTVAIALVWVAEAFNTASEYLCDAVSPGYHLSLGKAKDVGAGAVLICATGALVLGALTFWPYLSR
jgi:diacylglycerol kinase (ATP)